MKLKIIQLLIIIFITAFIFCERNDMYEFASGPHGPSFVTVGDSGKIYYSDDGRIWTEAVSPTTNALYGVVYGGGKFVAVGTAGTAVTSRDGIKWESNTIGAGTIPFYCIAYGNGTFVAAGQFMSLATQVQVSTDGLNWTDRKISAGLQSMNGITFGNGRFYTLGNNISGWYSDDNGTTWTASNQLGSDYWGVVYANSKFTAVGAGGMIRESPTANSGTWVNVNIGTFPGQVLAITYGNDKYIVAGSAGDTAYSVSGTSWTLVNAGTANALNSVTYSRGLYVAVGDAGTVTYSADGLTWIYIGISSSTLRCIACRK